MNMVYKKDLSTEQQMMVQTEFNKVAKSKPIAYVLWFFTGVIGGHRFYVGDWKMGLGMLVTLGGFGFWALVDLFMIGSRLEKVNDNKELEIIQSVR